MSSPDTSTEARLRGLERSRSRERVLFAALFLLALTLAARPLQESPEVLDRLVVRELVVQDEAGTTRVRIGSEGDEERRARSAGIVVFDDAGSERGGLVTFDDGSVVFALDAPQGVGAAMRDRAAIIVAPDGSASMRLIDNQTSVPVRLVSDAAGGGGLEFLEYDLEKREYTVTRQDHSGASRSTHSLDD